MNINELSAQIYQNNKDVGWWDNPDRCLYEVCQLIITEIAEATEGERKDLMDDHLPDRKMGEVELADAMIRLLDLGGHLNLSVVPVSVPTQYMPESVAGKHLYIVADVIGFVASLFTPGSTVEDKCVEYSRVIDSIFYVGGTLDYDVHSAMLEKIEYNKQRADHKRENRAQVGGKKF